MPSRVVVLVSGTGSLLQSLIEASADPAYGAQIVAVGADRPGIAGLARAERAGLPTFVRRLGDFPDRTGWDESMVDAVSQFAPDLIVSAGFMKILGPPFLHRYGGRILNSHPALLPSFPGAHGVRDALSYGVKVTGCTMFLVDAGIDTGPILAQRAVDVLPDDTEDSLHERIKTAERDLLTQTVRSLVAALPTS